MPKILASSAPARGLIPGNASAAIYCSPLNPQGMNAAADNPLVQFKNVSVSLSGNPILSNLDLTVERGETLVLLGESGCGKTTTLKLVNRLLQPTLGEVMVEGKSTTAWDPIALRRHIGYVIQEGGLFPHFTIARNVGLVPSLSGWEEARIDDRVRELLNLVGLDPDRFAERYPRQLSGGQRQRVGVARALAADPPLMLLDEPFGALDPLTRASLQREFADLSRRLGKTAILVTHDVREALALADRVGLMHKGRLLLLESPDGFRASNNPQARAYLETLE
ncbi:MAG TPA: ATP-binding cassette domain-containing protein [Pyrinomonadaceae bacterium]|nr:ATP-binding cassette domain-containing protein [Pyrinomonadaceae bacterium]